MSRKKQIWYGLKLVFRSLFVLGLFAALFSYAMFQGGFVSWFLFYSIMTLVVLMLLYALIPLGSFMAEREFGDGVLLAGAITQVKVTIRRKWPFPFLYLSVVDDIDQKLLKQMPRYHNKMIFYPTMKREITFTYEIPEIKRGEYELHGVWLETSDMFGLFEKQKYVSLKETVLVYPNYHNIEHWSAYEKHEAETHMSSLDFVEDVTSIAGAREYVPGDKLTSIDWKVTARSNKLMTKEFEDHYGQNFLVILNNHLPDNHYQTLEAYEKSIELATSIVMLSNRTHLKMSLWTIGETSKAFSMDAGADHQKNIVKHLSKIEADFQGEFGASLKEYEDHIPQGITMIIVSTEVTDDMLERVRIYLSRRINVYFCLMDRGKKTDAWEEKRFEQLKRYGAEAYILSGSNLDHAIPTYASAGD
ncbi:MULTISPECIES: DUF58 domain-containing protein [Bacillaceae]|uniref:DUF58 domain-containing protein n=1 Tax=Evansella alkalicola TaxID=745819 RepID=A0ABS6JVF3_9BACI|nr:MULTISPECIES: DUF58 domain-containing protein [Bacillaceae]MBU9721227.1 DUF58 domain-containing protein [Bacillus alkalicola]